MQNLQVGFSSPAERVPYSFYSRIRRVKCGEEKPNCLRCTSTGRKCEYESAISRAFPSMAVLDKQPSLSPSTKWRERRAFAYYFQYAAASIGGGLDIDFWRTIIPQVCRSEPAVWDALIAIGSLFESPDPCRGLVSSRWDDSSTINQNQQDALNWYSHSVSAVRRGIERGNIGPFAGLITCILFICIECLLGSMYGAIRLYGQGVRLILSLRAQRACGIMTATEFSLLSEIIAPTFIRLGTFSPNSVWALVTALLRETECAPPTQELASLKSAREALVILAAEIPLFELSCEDYLQGSHAPQISEELMHQQRALSARLESWYAAYTKLLGSLRTRDGDGLPPSQVSASALLLAYYEMLFITLGVSVSPSRITTDDYTQNFQNIVTQATIALNGTARCDGTQPPFTFEISDGPPLWFTCLRCREPTIRRTALALLRRAHQVQGLHIRDQGAVVGEKTIMVEEAYAMEHQSYFPGIGNSSSVSRVSDPDLASSRFPSLADPGTSIPAARIIPQEARIRPHGVFRPRDGCPPEMTEGDIARWRRDSDQTFLQYSWNEHDLSNNTWKMAFGCVPIDL